MMDAKIEDNEKKGNQILERKSNWFVRILLIIFISVLLFLVFQSFYKNSLPYDFNAGLITVLFIITVLILSEAFDNMSIGKLLSLNREVTLKEKEVEKSKEENRELRKDIISLASVVTQNQSNNTYFGLPDEMLKNIGVVKAETEENNDDQEHHEKPINPEETEELVGNQGGTVLDGSQEGVGENLQDTSRQGTLEKEKVSEDVPRGYLTRSLENQGLERFISKQNMNSLELVRNVEFSHAFRGLDPIGDQKIIFDAYYKTPSKEYFIETIINKTNFIYKKYQIYTLIAKVYFYQQVKKTQAEIIIVLINIPENNDHYRFSRDTKVEEIYNQFRPAISNGLLRIETINFSDEDVKDIKAKYLESRN